MSTTPVNPEQVRQIGEALAANGRVLATLDDWRAIMFVVVGISIVVLIFAFGIIVALLRANRQDRTESSARLDRALVVSDKFGEAAGKLVNELAVQQALNARVETALHRVEDLLESLGRDGSRG